MERAGEETEIERDAEESEPGYKEASNGAGFERDFEAAGERADRGLGGAHIGADRHVHADEASQPRQRRTDRKSDRNQPTEEVADDEKDHDADDCDRRVLPLEISLCAFAHRRGYLLHPGAAGI